MGKILNFQVEKKQQKIKVVDIDVSIRGSINKKFNDMIKETRNMIIISRDIKGKNRAYSTFTDSETIFMLEKVKSEFINNY